MPLSQPMKGAIVYKIRGHQNPKTKEIFLIVSQTYREAMRNVPFLGINKNNNKKLTRIEFERYW